MQPITISGAQQEVDEWIKSIGVKYFSELTNLGILTEEVGELARVMVRTYGDQSSKSSDLALQMEDELADILWVILCIANQTGIDLTNAFRKNIEKKNSRDSQRHIQNKKLRKR